MFLERQLLTFRVGDLIKPQPDVLNFANRSHSSQICTTTPIQILCKPIQRVLQVGTFLGIHMKDQPSPATKPTAQRNHTKSLVLIRTYQPPRKICTNWTRDSIEL